MDQWHGATFKEYIRNGIACFLMGMSKDMKKKIGFVIVSGNKFSNIALMLMLGGARS
jgi:hypothetical protein